MARFGREEGYIEQGILDLRGNLTLKICSLVNCYSTVDTATSKLSVSSENYYTVTLTISFDPKKLDSLNT